MRRLRVLVACVLLWCALEVSGAAVMTTAAAAGVSGNATTGAPPAPPAPPASPAKSAICKTCACNSDLKLVDCSNKELEHHFPNLEDWNSLEFQPKEVRFDHNLLVHVMPFAKLEALQKLSLSHNHISKIEDLAFMNLSNVVEIDLSHNHLASEELSPHIFQGHFAPENYEPLNQMRVLRLGSNALHTLNSDLFMHLPYLEEIYLDSNPLEVIDRNTHIALTSVPYLKVLDLSRTMINKLPEHFLHTPRHLLKLLLAGNEFPEPPEGLYDSHALLHLDMSENPFTVLRSIPELLNLTTLVISHSPDLVEVSKGALAKLPALQHLYLHSNPRLSKVNAMALASPPTPPEESHVWPPLETIDLHDNALGYLESTLVGRWDLLKEVRLDGNPWVCDCENQWMIQNLLPTLERMDPKFGTGLTCAQPDEMRGQALRRLQSSHYHMRCLDLYGNHPEHDAPILVGVLVGVLLAAPATLALALLWRRCPAFTRAARARRGAEYSRAFYKPAETEPDFM